jgi:hypothetical protein
MARRKKGTPTMKPLSRDVVEQMSDAELDRLIARENLVRYGSVVAPVTGTRALQVVADPDEPDEAPPAETDWTKVTKPCPHCHEVKAIVPGFGLVPKRGVIKPQSWCKDCRAGTNYNKMPRTYKTRR